MKRETIIQQEIISVCRFLADGILPIGKFPELDLIYHIPNEGKRSPAEGARLKREGLKAGIPDLHLPVASACGKYHSLYIELKTEIGPLRSEQLQVIRHLRKYHNRARVCRDARTAMLCIAEHLGELELFREIENNFGKLLNPI